MRAAQNGYVKACQALVERKADLEAKDLEGRTALAYACLSDAAGCVQILAAAGADVNVKFRNHTPLTAAVKGDFLEVVTVLMKHKANPNARFKDKSCVDLAYARENTLMVAVLEGRTASKPMTAKDLRTENVKGAFSDGFD